MKHVGFILTILFLGWMVRSSANTFNPEPSFENVSVIFLCLLACSIFVYLRCWWRGEL